ncbi:hypothetical protein Pelo_19125 [Pelomyxa schiedti]|nr:hypothetical protein Pelo_19125 [Pelomyxa schiedti]
MERTIDAILQMKGEAPINTEVGAPVPKVDQLARDEAVARALQHKLLEDDLAVHGLTVEQFIALQNSRRIRSGALPSPSDPRVATSPISLI